jgi:hypothetical protein
VTRSTRLTDYTDAWMHNMLLQISIGVPACSAPPLRRPAGGLGSLGLPGAHWCAARQNEDCPPQHTHTHLHTRHFAGM